MGHGNDEGVEREYCVRTLTVNWTDREVNLFTIKITLVIYLLIFLGFST